MCKAFKGSSKKIEKMGFICLGIERFRVKREKRMAKFVPPVWNTDLVNQKSSNGRLARSNYYAYEEPLFNPYLSEDVVTFRHQESSRRFVRIGWAAKLKNFVTSMAGTQMS